MVRALRASKLAGRYRRGLADAICRSRGFPHLARDGARSKRQEVDGARDYCWDDLIPGTAPGFHSLDIGVDDVGIECAQSDGTAGLGTSETEEADSYPLRDFLPQQPGWIADRNRVVAGIPVAFARDVHQ